MDKGWKFNGPLETDQVASGMFARKGILNLEGLGRLVEAIQALH
jgi:hypothetical protein